MRPTTSSASPSTAKQMIMRFGMSDRLGPRVLGRSHGMPFIGRELGSEPDYSDEIAREIDDEIRRIVEESRDRARALLAEHMDELHQLAGLLIEHETINRDQFERLLAGEAEESVFRRDEEPTDDSADTEAAADSPSPAPAPAFKPRPYPLPGALAKKLPPEKAG